MALSIKHDEADRLARELAQYTGETLTDAVLNALRERLEREKLPIRTSDLRNKLARIRATCRDLPVLDDRPADEILGYDEAGLPT